MVVDGSGKCLSLLEDMRGAVGFRARRFPHPAEALTYASEHTADMILIDFEMSETDSLAFIREIRKLYRDIPILMITEKSETPQLSRLEDEAFEFFVKPFARSYFLQKLESLALLRQYIKFVSSYRLKDDEFGNHRVRVGHFAKIIASGLNWDKNDQDLIYYAAQLHDIGMNSIPDSILFKTESLTDDEMGLVKRHTSIGRIMLQAYSNPYLKMASVVSLTHHERFNGSGYPAGLSGPAIPVPGRITALADSFDVLISARPYKPDWDFDKSLSFISDNSDILFDPGMVKAFVANSDLIKGVCAHLADCRYEALA